MLLDPLIIRLRSAVLIALIAMTCACQSMDAVDTPILATAPTIAELENTTYVGITRVPLTLTDGEWQGEPFTVEGASRPSVGLVHDFRLTGDLNDNGAEEAIVLLWSNPGGSGTFDFIAVIGRDKTGAPLNLATAALGDRVRIRSAIIDAGRIVIDVVQAGPGDAACCPGQKFQRTFTLADHALNEVSSKDQGRQSIADLAGIEWVLTRFNRDEPLPDSAEVTLRFNDDRMSGKSACNRYSGSVTEGDTPGALTVNGPMMSTRMACPPPTDEIERRYLDTLQAINQYSFMAGNLALSWRKDNEIGTMIFTLRKISDSE